MSVGGVISLLCDRKSTDDIYKSYLFRNTGTDIRRNAQRGKNEQLWGAGIRLKGVRPELWLLFLL